MDVILLFHHDIYWLNSKMISISYDYITEYMTEWNTLSHGTM